MYSSVIFSVISKCVAITAVYVWPIVIAPEKMSFTISSNSLLPLASCPQPQVNSSSVFFPMHVPIRDIADKWSNTVWTFRTAFSHLAWFQKSYPQMIISMYLVPHSLYCWITFHCLDMPHFIYPFICWWTLGFSTFWFLGLVLLWNSCAHFVWTHLQFSWEYIQAWN